MLRQLAIALLDDDQGINEKAYKILTGLLLDSSNTDILRAVDCTDSRFYLTAEAVKRLSRG